MTIPVRSYDGEMLDRKDLSPAQSARIKFLHCIATDVPNAMKLIPDEQSKTSKNTTYKLESTGLDLDPNKPKYFVY